MQDVLKAITFIIDSLLITFQCFLFAKLKEPKKMYKGVSFWFKSLPVQVPVIKKNVCFQIENRSVHLLFVVYYAIF